MLIRTEPLTVVAVAAANRRDGTAMLRGDGSPVYYLDAENVAGYREGHGRFWLGKDCPAVGDLGRPGSCVVLTINAFEEAVSYAGTDRVSYKVKLSVVNIEAATDAQSATLKAARAA